METCKLLQSYQSDVRAFHDARLSCCFCKETLLDFDASVALVDTVMGKRMIVDYCHAVCANDNLPPDRKITDFLKHLGG